MQREDIEHTWSLLSITILLSKVCHGNGEENEVIPKSHSSQDTSWSGMMKYAWSG